MRFLFIAAILIQACGAADESGDAGSAPALAGTTWVSNCLNIPGAVRPGIKAVYEFAGATMVLTMAGYADKACSLPEETITEERTWTIGSAVGGLTNAWAIDYVGETGTVYQIVSVTGDTLRIGDTITGDTTTPEERPTSLSTTVELRRQ